MRSFVVGLSDEHDFDIILEKVEAEDEGEAVLKHSYFESEDMADWVNDLKAYTSYEDLRVEIAGSGISVTALEL